MYSRVQHTLFCHLCRCEPIPRSLSDSISKIILCPLTLFTFKSFHLHDFSLYLCSSLSLSVFYLFIAFSSQLLSLLRFARAAVTSFLPVLSWFPFTHLSGFLPSSLPSVSLRRFSFISEFLCSLLVLAISRRKISDVPNGLIRRIKQHSTNTMEMSDRKL